MSEVDEHEPVDVEVASDDESISLIPDPDGPEGESNIDFETSSFVEDDVPPNEEPCDYRDNYYERYYPVKDINGENQKIYKTYKDIENPTVTFIGRCGMYVYIDMDQAINSSLATVTRFKESIK